MSVFNRGTGGVAVLSHIGAEVEVLALIERQCWVTIAEVGVVVDFRLVEASPGGGVVVITGMVGGVREVPCLGSETATSCFTSSIMLGDENCVESSGGEGVLGLVQDSLVEDCP